MARGLSKLLPAAVMLAGMLLGAPAAAQPVLERVAESGVLRVGMRDHVRPFSFRNEDSEFVGFSVDILRKIHTALEAELGRELALEITEVDAQTRVSQVAEGTLDITCDIASKTWEREQRIDYSLTIFFNGTRILTERRIGLTGMSALENSRIGAIDNSSTMTVLGSVLPRAQLVPFADMSDAMQALEAGEIDGISNISIILRGLQSHAARPGRYIVLPRADYLNAEPMACILPEDDSRWRDFVNHTLVRMLNGVEDYRGVYVDLYHKWFGPDGDLHYPLSLDAIRHFREIRSWIDG